MKIIREDVWEKGDVHKWKPVTKEEYDQKVLPIVEEWYNKPKDSYPASALFASALDEVAHVDTLFWASPEQLEAIKKEVMAVFFKKCVLSAEEHTGYRYRQNIRYED